MENISCPYCGSNQLHAHKKGYSGVKGFLGVATIGLIGGLAGTIGSNNIELTCLSCGRKSAPGQQVESAISNLQAFPRAAHYQSWSIAQIAIAVIVVCALSILLFGYIL